jgi:hypothetical protein
MGVGAAWHGWPVRDMGRKSRHNAFDFFEFLPMTYSKKIQIPIM